MQICQSHAHILFVERGMISRTGTHALKAMAVLGSLPEGTFAGARQVAARIKAPANYLGKLLRQLAHAGLVEGRKGSQGGFRLSRDVSAITLFEILEPIEHVTRHSGCILGRTKCGHTELCSLHKGWSTIRQDYLAFLRHTLLSEVAVPAA
jgi:Rrf2 family protein